jgi:hypothetical protein
MRDLSKLQKKSDVPQGNDNLNYSQKWAKAVRPQKPSDNTQGGQPKWTPGTMPVGGFRSVFSFGSNDSKTNAGTRGMGKKVY